MEFVVDTNILYSYFWKQSFTRKILMSQNIRLISPEFALEEINANESNILRKTGLSKKEFNDVRSNLAIAVEIIPLEEYGKFLKPALSFSPDPNDVDFLALALKLKLPLWSNDSGLKKQNKVKIFSTSDLLNKPEFSEVLFPDE